MRPTLVYLVGAGPGDPGLITRRGWDCLARADLVLYDALVNPALLERAPRAEHLCVGKHGVTPQWAQDEITRRMIESAAAGRVVVRLKGGDPAIFGHLTEEIRALDEAGIGYEIVPGVSAGVAAGSYASLALTSRDAASAVAFVAGQHSADKPEPWRDYRELAHFPGTLVFYMGVTTAPRWTTELLAGGMPGDTPALIVRRCTWPDQVSIRCRLDEVAQRLTAARMRPPVLVIVGRVASAPGFANWFDQRPLHGQTVWLTRPRERSEPAASRLAELGARVVSQPLIEIRPLADPGALDAALGALREFDWIVFASRSGVEHTFGRLEARGGDARAFAGLRIAAIGPATAEALAQRGLRADLEPDEFRSEALAEAFAGGSPQRVLVVRASRGRDVLAPALAAAGHAPREVVAYENVDVETIDAELASALAAGRVDWITVSSPAIARAVARWLPASVPRPKLASLSPVTTSALRESGLPPTVEASQATFDSLIDAMLGRPGYPEQ